jgi:hypothetical protein
VDLRSPFWGSKATKAGDVFAAISNFGPRKAGLKIIFRLREEHLYVKVDPPPTMFLLVPKRLEKFLRVLCLCSFNRLGFR